MKIILYYADSLRKRQNLPHPCGLSVHSVVDFLLWHNRCSFLAQYCPMRIKPELLAQHLKQQMMPVYLVTGDEPLQVMESMDALRAAARERGHLTRERLTADRGFSWAQLTNVADSLSLFADRRILDLEIEGAGPGKEGGQALTEYCERPADDAVLLIQMGKLDARSQSAKWFKAIDHIGAVVQVWPKKPYELPAWLQQRSRRHGLELDREAIGLLAARIEGNLLAAAQEVEKLALLHGQTRGTVPLSLREVAASVADSARYSVFDLVDAATGGSLLRALRILKGLQQEGVAAPLVLWSLSNEIRTLRELAIRTAAGEPEQRVLAKVWSNRKPIVTAALKRLRLPTWGILLQHCAQADRLIKNARSGREWDALQQIVASLAQGRLLFPQLSSSYHLRSTD